jgi:hypothetical protein
MSAAVFAALAIMFSVGCHRTIANFIGASVAAAVLTDLFFHLFSYLVDGSVDALVLISAITAFLGALVLALGFGFMMKKAGTRAKPKAP